MISILNKIKKFGLLEILVFLSAFYVVSMLIWIASTRSAVEEKANTVKSNHKIIVDLIDQVILNHDNKEKIQSVKKHVNELCSSFQIYD